MLRLIETVYSHDAWATDRLLDAMDDLTDEEYRTLTASRHGSIHETFAHLLLTEWRFFCWLDESLSLADAWELSLGGEEVPSIAWARRRWQPLREQVAWFIGSLSEGDLYAERSGAWPDGSDVRLPLWTILLHVITHNTHTRGQIIAALNRAGRMTENTDLFGYAQRKQIRSGLTHHV